MPRIMEAAVERRQAVDAAYVFVRGSTEASAKFLRIGPSSFFPTARNGYLTTSRAHTAANSTTPSLAWRMRGEEEVARMLAQQYSHLRARLFKDKDIPEYD